MAAVAALIALVAQGTAPAQQTPGFFSVDTVADGNDGECARDCTLREAVNLANAAQGSTINLRPGVYRLTQGPLVLRNSFIIGPGLVGGQGAGARTTVIDARGRSRVIEVPAGSNSLIAGVTITGGAAATGAGILVQATGVFQVYNSIVEGNTATGRGGGIQSLGDMAVNQSLVTGNRAGSGGGMAVEPNGDGIVLSSTFSGNTASANGGGIITGGSLTTTGATIAGNTAASGGGVYQESVESAQTNLWNSIVNGAGAGGACGGSISGIPRGTFANNLSDDATCAYTGTEGTNNANARLASLDNNGGPTDTRSIGAGSPAINGGNPNFCINSTDQRGAPNVGTCDVGAFEFGGRPPEPQLPPPVAGETVNVSRARGIVKIKLPGSDEFFELEDGQQVPVGSTFDTVKGRVNLQAAGRQRAWFYQGIFKLGQGKGAKPLSTMTLTGKLQCGRSSSATAAARKKKKRRLWGDGKGKFRTKGSFSSATVRGTRWMVEDRCNGTFTRVAKGRVAVRDFRRKRTVIVTAGHSYFARK